MKKILDYFKKNKKLDITNNEKWMDEFGIKKIKVKKIYIKLDDDEEWRDGNVMVDVKNLFKFEKDIKTVRIREEVQFVYVKKDREEILRDLNNK